MSKQRVVATDARRAAKHRETRVHTLRLFSFLIFIIQSQVGHVASSLRAVWCAQPYIAKTSGACRVVEHVTVTQHLESLSAFVQANVAFSRVRGLVCAHACGILREK